MAARLTWHQGTVRPYASLWYTVQRVASMNCMLLSELPAGGYDAGLGYRRLSNRAELLFNERNGFGGETIAVDAFAGLLGEPVAAFDWCHLGRLPKWARFFICRGFRLCRACLSAGYHSALLSLRLLEACPIHGCGLLERCGCGKSFSPWLRSGAASSTGCCVCGRFSLFTRQSCRAPAMKAERCSALQPVACWLQELSSVIRPRLDFTNGAGARERDAACWLELLRQWCDELGLGYPDCFVEPPKQARRRVSRSATVLRVTAPRDQAGAARRFTQASSLCSDTPASWTYRAMARHLRRHVARDSEHWVQHFMRWPDPLAIARQLSCDRGALLAFGEMLWAHEIEELVHERRWPCRPTRDREGARVPRRISVPGLHADAGGLGPAARTWLEYHAAGASFAALWHRAMRRAVNCGRSGIANWASCAADLSATLSWSARFQNDVLSFVSLCDETAVAWERPRRDKSARRHQWQQHLARRRLEAAAACVGPCLTWSGREGWTVAESLKARDEDVRRFRLLGIPGELPICWLFRSADGYAARPSEIRLQVSGDSPAQVIETLRQAVRQYRRVYGTPLEPRPRRPLPPLATLEKADRQLESRYRAQIDVARRDIGFWRCQRLLEIVVRQRLTGATQE